MDLQDSNRWIIHASCCELMSEIAEIIAEETVMARSSFMPKQRRIRRERERGRQIFKCLSRLRFEI